MSRSLDHSEALVRNLIREIPDGVYAAEELLDPIQAPGWPEERPLLKVQVTVAGDQMTFDYTGTGPQVRGGLNCPLSVTCNCTWFVVKALTDPSIPINQGCYRPVKIIAPEGSVLNCRYPASVISGNTETSPRVIDLILKALAPALPHRVLGQSIVPRRQVYSVAVKPTEIVRNGPDWNSSLCMTSTLAAWVRAQIRMASVGFAFMLEMQEVSRSR